MADIPQGLTLTLEKLIKRYVLSLVAIVGLLIALFFILEVKEKRQALSLKIVNQAGKQRMLSQRIVKDSLLIWELKKTDEKNIYVQQLENALIEFTGSHQTLLEYNEKLTHKHEKHIKLLFDEINPHFQTLAKLGFDILSNVKEGSLMHPQFYDAVMGAASATEEFLSKMDDIVVAYEKAGHDIYKDFQGTKQLIILFLVLIVLAEAIFIFRPIVKEIKYQIYSIAANSRDKLLVISELKQDLVKAQSLIKAKTNLFYALSQETRTPLQGILAMTDLIEKTTAITDEQRTYLATICKSTSELLSLVKDMQAFSQMDKAKIETRELPFSLKETLDKVVDSTYSKIIESGRPIKFEFDCDDSVPSAILGDYDRLVQVVWSLLENSLAHTKSGVIRLAVSDTKPNFAESLFEENLATGHARVFFTICDTGATLDPNFHSEDLKYISESIKTNNRIDLSFLITREVAEIINGKIAIKNNSPKGVTFVFGVDLLPLSDKEFNKLYEISRRDGNLNITASRGLSVLVAEDNKTNQEVIRACLKKLGLSCDIANNGKEALELIEKKSYQLVLMDLKMPEVDGWEATRKIRENKELDQQPIIIALTMYSSLADRREAKEAGINDVYTKPMPLIELAKIIEYHFGIKTHKKSSVAEEDVVEI